MLIRQGFSFWWYKLFNLCGYSRGFSADASNDGGWSKTAIFQYLLVAILLEPLDITLQRKKVSQRVFWKQSLRTLAQHVIADGFRTGSFRMVFGFIYLTVGLNIRST